MKRKTFSLTVGAEIAQGKDKHPPALSSGPDMTADTLINTNDSEATAVMKAVVAMGRRLAKLELLVEQKEIDLEKEQAAVADIAQTKKMEWELIFAFVGKYKGLIEGEIDRLRLENPQYWSFEWFHTTLERAPWYDAIYNG